MPRTITLNNKRTTEDSDPKGKRALKKLRQDNAKDQGHGRGGGKGDKGDKKKSTDPKDAPAELAKLVAKDTGCFMCGGEHAVSKHPAITKSQVNTLWDKHYAAKGQTNPFKRAMLKKLADTEDFENNDEAPPKFRVLINGVMKCLHWQTAERDHRPPYQEIMSNNCANWTNQ